MPGCFIRPGDLALVPHGQGHVVASAQGLVASKLFEIPREQLSERYETLRLGGDGERTTMICGLFQFDDPAAQQLITLLPEVITVNTWATPQAEWIRSTLRMIAAEAREMSPGGETVITRLADILVVHAIRYWITHSTSTQTGWLGALHDPRIGPVIAKIHRRPTHRWTLESLAAEASMSRSAFAARFTELVGESAIQYVTRWQMNAARSRLAEGGVTVGRLLTRSVTSRNPPLTERSSVIWESRQVPRSGPDCRLCRHANCGFRETKRPTALNFLYRKCSRPTSSWFRYPFL